MPKFQPLRHEQILERLINRVVARTDLSDISDSSTLKHFLAAVARELDASYYQLTQVTNLFSIDLATGGDLDERAKDILPALIKRLRPRPAVGALQFGRDTTAGTVIIPAGSVGKTVDGVSASTDQQSQITTGSSLSASIPATAVDPGAAGNVAAGSLLKFGAKLPGVDTVTNPISFVQGRDSESDDEFRARLRGHVDALARSTVETLEFIVKNVEDTNTGKTVIFSHVFEDPVDIGKVIVYIDDGAGTAESSTPVTGEVLTAAAIGGEEFLRTDFRPIKLESAITLRKNAVVLTQGVDYYINPASGYVFFVTPLTAGDVVDIDYTYFTGLIAEVQKVIDGDPADRVNYPGYRAAGVLVRVLAPVVINPQIVLTAFLREGFDAVTAEADIRNALFNYVNQGGISADVVRNEQIERVMALDAVYDINLLSPLTNIPILDDQIARIEDNDVTVNF